MDEDYAVEVQVLWSKGQASLVQWNDAGRVRRTVVPRTIVIEEGSETFVYESELDKGIPYGVNWETRLPERFIITGARVAEQLESAGVWTDEDYTTQPNIVRQAVLGAAREILVELSSISHSIKHPKEE